MRRIALGLLCAGLLALLAWQWAGGLPGFVATALPDFPELPAPLQRLAPESAGTLYFASRSPFDLEVLLDPDIPAQPTTGTGTLTLPAGASPETPVPAAVLLHGSGGIVPGREMEYAKFLAANGIAAIVVDYYAPRGITPDTPYALRIVSVTEFDAVADAYGALRLLAAHPAIDPDRIALMGFSYGGMAVRVAMDERVRRALAPGLDGFAGFVDFYGPCFQAFGTAATNGAPLLTLRGTEDGSNDLDACRDREAELRALGVAVEAHVYPGAGHAWEALAPRSLRENLPYVTGCTLHYDSRGRPSVRGTPIADLPPRAPRTDRIAARMRSGRAMLDCVKTGYITGRDEATHDKARAALLGFLRHQLAP